MKWRVLVLAAVAMAATVAAAGAETRRAVPPAETGRAVPSAETRRETPAAEPAADAVLLPATEAGIAWVLPHDGGTPRDPARLAASGPREFTIRARAEEGACPLTHAVSRMDLVCRNTGAQPQEVTVHIDLSGDGTRTNADRSAFGGMSKRDFLFIQPPDDGSRDGTGRMPASQTSTGRMPVSQTSTGRMPVSRMGQAKSAPPWRQVDGSAAGWVSTVRFTALPGDTRVGLSPWYTYGDYLSFVESLPASPHLTKQCVATSDGGRAHWELTVTDSSVPAAGKRRVVWHAREHAYETFSSFAVEGLVGHLLSEAAAAARREYVFTIHPMCNVDGVAGGCEYRGGYDHPKPRGTASGRLAFETVDRVRPDLLVAWHNWIAPRDTDCVFYTDSEDGRPSRRAWDLFMQRFSAPGTARHRWEDEADPLRKNWFGRKLSDDNPHQYAMKRYGTAVWGWEMPWWGRTTDDARGAGAAFAKAWIETLAAMGAATPADSAAGKAAAAPADDGWFQPFERVADYRPKGPSHCYRQFNIDWSWIARRPEQIPEFLSEADPAALAEFCRAGNIDGTVVMAVPHHGYCTYDTRVGTKFPGMKGDWFGRTIEELHKRRIAAFGYVTLNWNWKYLREHLGSDFTQGTPDADGLFPGKALICFNAPGYLELVEAYTREVLERYPVDGMRWDILHTAKACTCAGCKRLFRERYGEDLVTWEGQGERRRLEFEEVTIRRAVERLTRLCRQIKPSVEIWQNGIQAYTLNDLDMGRKLDIAYNEYGDPFNLLFVRGATGKAAAINGLMNKAPTEPPLPLDHALWRTCLALGGRCYSYYGHKHTDPRTVLPDALYQAWHREQLAPFYKMAAEIQPYLEGAAAVPHVGVVFAERMRDRWPGRDRKPYVAAMEAMTGACLSRNIPMEFINRLDLTAPAARLERFKLLVLPLAPDLEPEEQAAIDRYVKAGGRVLTPDDAACRDAALPQRILDLAGPPPVEVVAPALPEAAAAGQGPAGPRVILTRQPREKRWVLHLISDGDYTVRIRGDRAAAWRVTAAYPTTNWRWQAEADGGDLRIDVSGPAGDRLLILE